MYKILVFWLIVFTLTIQECHLVEGCHAGHTQTNTEEDDSDDYEYEYSDYSSTSTSNATNSAGGSRRRRKREVDQFGEDYPILRQYFRDCLFDKVPEIWDWKSVVDFTILKTLWFFYSGTIECIEATGKDNAACWKACVDVYLRNTSSLIEPAKFCVGQYEIDFKNNISVYQHVTRTFDPPPIEQSNQYTECVQAQYNEADPSSLFLSTGFSRVTAETRLDIRNIVDFVKNHVLCVICDYSPLPSGQSRPQSRDNILIGETQLTDGDTVYTTTWPFGLEALIRKDARLRYAIHFCNNELEGTFRSDPPPSLGWTQWYTWGVCNAVCGSRGTQIRQRVCLDKPRKNCQGPKTESRTCYNSECAHWSKWSQFTPCISTCDLSEQYSFRFCENGKFGDVGCQGERRRSRSCAVSSCPVPWSSWSICTVTCGVGAQYRSGGESVMKVRTETRACKIKDCPQRWSQWSPWGPCSKTCGYNGFRQRVRICESDVRCIGPTQQTSACKAQLPPCQDTWSSWTSWSSCNYQMRTRVCQREGKCSGMADNYRKCIVSRDSQTYMPRRVRYQWSGWSAWSKCDKTCGNGKRIRSRVCGGSSLIPVTSCAGKHFQVLRCRIRACSTPGTILCRNHYIVNNTCYKNRINCLGEIGRRFCRKTCGFC